MQTAILEGPLVLSLSKDGTLRSIKGLMPCRCFDKLSTGGGKN